MDFEGATLRVRRQLQRMRDGSGLAFLPLKSPEGRREVALGPETLEALKRQRVKQSEERLILGPAYKDQGLVFTTSTGTPLQASNVVNRSFKPLLERAGIARIRFHELRHACASVMAKAGVAPRYAQDRLRYELRLATTRKKRQPMTRSQAAYLKIRLGSYQPRVPL